MKVWTKLNEEEYDAVWNKFEDVFSFKPSVYPKDWPSSSTNKPFLKFSLDKVWNNALYANDLEIKGISIFIEITQPGETIFALDWQHTSYKFDPRLHKQNPEAGDVFHISFVPDGDYYIFLTHDFDNVWFGHPWEGTVTIIGSRIIEATLKNLPEAFKEE